MYDSKPWTGTMEPTDRFSIETGDDGVMRTTLRNRAGDTATRVERLPAGASEEDEIAHMISAGFGLMRQYRKRRDAHRLPGPRRPLAVLKLRENDIRHRADYLTDDAKWYLPEPPRLLEHRYEEDVAVTHFGVARRRPVAPVPLAACARAEGWTWTKGYGAFLRTWRRTTTKIFRDNVGNYVRTVRKTVVVTAAGDAWNKLDVGPDFADESDWVRCRPRCWSNPEHRLEYLAWAEERIAILR